jgi:hypothetical protein
MTRSAASRPLGADDASDPNVMAAVGILGIIARTS